MSTQNSTINRDSQAYWNKRAATFTRDATVEYERWLLDLLALEAGEEILDMGCATGTLAVPLARAGHRVHGCDFAEAMLAILDERAAADKLPVTSHLLAWEDDWEEAGLGENSVDVAFASRSLMSGDVSACVRKLDAAARSRAAVVVSSATLPTCSLPWGGSRLSRPHGPSVRCVFLPSTRPARTFVAWPAPSHSPRASSDFSTRTRRNTSYARLPLTPLRRQRGTGS